MASDDNLRGVLFREQNKKSEKSPDFTGHLTIEGVRYRLAGWTREGRDGKKFLSIAATAPEEQHPQPGRPNAYAEAKAKRAPEEIPF